MIGPEEFEPHSEKRDKYRLFLQRWESDVEGRAKASWEAVKVAAEYAKLALQTAFVINGGALVALSPLTKALSMSNATASGIAIYFVCGLSAAALSCLCAYLNFNSIAATHAYQGSVNAFELNAGGPIELGHSGRCSYMVGLTFTATTAPAGSTVRFTRGSVHDFGSFLPVAIARTTF